MMKKIEYKNSNETTFRNTERAVREVAVIHHESEVCLIEELNAAAKCSNTLFCQRSSYVTSLGDCQMHHNDLLSSLDLDCCAEERLVQDHGDVKIPK